MIGQADIHKAIYTVWSGSGLDALFQAYWAAGETAFSVVLHESEASPGSPFPYCVYDLSGGIKQSRMSGLEGCSDEIREIRDSMLRFKVHAKDTGSATLSQKEIAAALMEEVMKIFGGHPTVKPTAMSLDNGNHLVTTYQNDQAIKSGEDEYAWLVTYMLKVDVPIQALTA